MQRMGILLVVAKSPCVCEREGECRRTECVGDITTRCEPAYLGRVNFISSIKVIKQMKAQGL